MQGFNMGRYVPPEVEGTTTGNRLHGRRAGASSTPTVRFEMPFAVWCASCPRPTLIGQGVRFNAEKRRVGAYHSTPVWSFRLRHADCGGALEVRTDPRNAAYVVVSGGTPRDDGGAARDALGPAGPGGRDEERRNAFESLEKTIGHREQLRRADERIVGLLEASARHWHDPYAQNQRLRSAFRSGRRERDRDAAAAERLCDSMGLALDLLPMSEDDSRRAALVDFGTARRDSDDSDDDGRPNGDQDHHHQRAVGRSALAKPLFAPVGKGANDRQVRCRRPSPPSWRAPSRVRDSLVSELVTATRAAHDPFLWDSRAHPHLKPQRQPSSPSPPPPRWPGLKRKRGAGGAQQQGDARQGARPPPAKVLAQEATLTSSLVQYDSD